MKLDRLLGPGVVTARNGSLCFHEDALLMQLHQRSPRKGERCWCPACKAERDRKPELAAVEIRQPWEPKLREAA